MQEVYFNIFNIWKAVLIQISNIDLWTWIFLFVISIIYDIVYAKSVLHIAKLHAKQAANLSVILYLMMAYGTINYVKNFINLIPIAIGAWIGTYCILKYETIKREKIKSKIKNQNNKK